MATKVKTTKKEKRAKATEKLKSKEKKVEILVVEDDSQKVRFSTLNIDGDKYKTLLTEKFKSRQKWELPDTKKIHSEIPGTVIKIHVEEGQKVQEGDLMMVLEAMKMKNKILFTENGVVKRIYVKENEKIPKNHLMIELK